MSIEKCNAKITRCREGAGYKMWNKWQQSQLTIASSAIVHGAGKCTSGRQKIRLTLSDVEKISAAPIPIRSSVGPLQQHSLNQQSWLGSRNEQKAIYSGSALRSPWESTVADRRVRMIQKGHLHLSK